MIQHVHDSRSQDNILRRILNLIKAYKHAGFSSMLDFQAYYIFEYTFSIFEYIGFSSMLDFRAF